MFTEGTVYFASQTVFQANTCKLVNLGILNAHATNPPLAPSGWPVYTPLVGLQNPIHLKRRVPHFRRWAGSSGNRRSDNV